MPLLREARIIGVLVLGRYDPGDFDQSAIELVQSFAEQAVIALSSAAALHELRERTSDLQELLEHQTATSDVLKVISRSAFDLDPVFQAVVATAVRLCHADQATIYRYKDGEYRWAAGYSLAPDYERIEREVRIRPGIGTLVGRVALEGRMVQILDAWTDPLYEVKEDARVGGVHTMLGVPLLRDGEPIGVIGLARQRIEPFTERQIGLVSTFADQAVIAIENTRLLTEQREALQRQTATAEVLQVINASPGDLTPVFDAILDKAHQLCGAAIGSLATYDGEYMRVVATHGYPGDIAEVIRQPYLPTVTAGRPLIGGERYVHIPDIRAIQPRPAGRSGFMIEKTDVRTGLQVPLRKDGVFIGQITAFRAEVRPFSEKEIALLENFAAQAVIAMENARLLGELRDRTAELAERNSAFAERIDHQAATIDVLKEMSASPGDAQPVFDLICRQAEALLGVQAVTLFEYDGRLVHMRTNPRHEQMVGGAAFAAYKSAFPMVPHRGSMTCRAILDGTMVHIRDVTAEPGLSNTVRELGHKTQVTIPLLRNGHAIGAITTASMQVDGISDTQIELLKTFAEQAVIAIGSAETFRALQERTAALAQRNSEYGEQIEHQSATIDVLKEMSASPGDPQPVFDLIVRRATKVCNSPAVILFEYDGALVHIRSGHSAAAFSEPGSMEAFNRQFPMPPHRGSISCRAILDREIVHIRDMLADPALLGTVRGLGHRSQLSVPLLRDGIAIGAITTAADAPGGFSDSQVELLKTFAEQAVIAIGSAQTYRALQERTAALAQRNSEFGEKIEHQSATIDVLKAMSASPGDPQPVFDLIVERARDICDAYGAGVWEFDGSLIHFRAGTGTSDDPEVKRAMEAMYPMVPSRDWHVGRTILDKRLTRFDDYDASDLNPALRGLTAKSAVMVPLMRGDAVIGVVGIGSRERGGFSDSQIELLNTFAEQAVIAIASAETYRALQERTAALAQRNSEFGEQIEQQAATIDVLKVMSSTPDDTQPVFEQIVRRARELCNGYWVALLEYDGQLIHLRAETVGEMNSDVYTKYRALWPMVPRRDSMVSRAILDKELLHIRNFDEVPWLLQAVRDTGPKSNLVIPLLRDGQAIGAITLSAIEPGGFTDSQVALLQTFAEQAVIAITSVANFRALRERTEALARSVAELQALEEVLRAVNSSLDLNTVLETIINRAVRLSRADEGTIYEFDQAEEVFVPKSAYGMTEERVAALRDRRIRVGETPLGNSAAMRAPLHIPDLTQTPDEAGAPELVNAGIHALLAVPLLREDKVVGGLVIRRRAAGGFPPTTVTLMQTFAGQSVLAIENARLFQELATRGEEARRARIAAEAALSDLRRTQDRLVQTEKLASLGQLTAGIAHEIKNPLNFVNNFSDLSVDLLEELHEAVAPDKLDLLPELRAEIDEITTTLKGNLAKIAQHGRRADSIVKNMLLHSRSGPSEHGAIDLNATVEEALNLAYHGARAATQGFNITMEKALDPKVGTVDAFPQEFIRVMLNLINNGFYAAHKRAAQIADPSFEPMLTLTTRDLGDQVEIRVRDNGTGIPADAREKIFEPFFTTKPAGEGTGLGLSLSHDIVVKQHGGQLSVDSQVDAYTEFVVTLPRRMASPDRHGGA